MLYLLFWSLHLLICSIWVNKLLMYNLKITLVLRLWLDVALPFGDKILHSVLFFRTIRSLWFSGQKLTCWEKSSEFKSHEVLRCFHEPVVSCPPCTSLGSKTGCRRQKITVRQSTPEYNLHMFSLCTEKHIYFQV